MKETDEWLKLTANLVVHIKIYSFTTHAEVIVVLIPLLLMMLPPLLSPTA